MTPPPERVKSGELWALGDHRLICGDCTDADIIEKLMDGNASDIVITSPPYGASGSSKIRDHYVRGSKTNKSFYNEYDDNADEWLGLIRESYEIMKSYSVAQFINIQMLADNKRSLIRFLNDNAENLCDVIVWDKIVAPPQMHGNVLNNQFEFIFVFGNAKRTIPFGNFHGNISNIIVQTVGNNQYADVHRAVYPIALPAKLMEIASTAESIFDPFGGTGTTMIACEQLNRKCYMCELDPRYCDVIIKRWEDYTGKKAELVKDK